MQKLQLTGLQWTPGTATLSLETWTEASSMLTMLALIPTGAAAGGWGWDPDFVECLDK